MYAYVCVCAGLLKTHALGDSQVIIYIPIHIYHVHIFPYVCSICVYTCIYVRKNVCAGLLKTHALNHSHVITHMHIYTYQLCIFMYVYTNICIHISMYMCIYM